MTLKMSEGGDKVAVVESPTYVITPRSTEVSSESNGRGITKKHVLIVVGVVFLVGFIIAGILIGMHIFSEQQKEIIKFTLEFKSSGDGGNVKQNVVSDKNDNSVMYHITKDGKDVDIVNDFNRNMQVVKMEFQSSISCYVSALNRSAAADPSQITAPDDNVKSDAKRNAKSGVFVIADSPVTDRSFLPKKALDMCKDVSVYWAYRGCDGQTIDPPNNKTSSVDRQRRAVYNAGYYGSWPCLNGCCWTYCSCVVQIIEYVYTGYSVCNYYTGSNCGYVRYRQATPGFYC